LTPDSSYQSYFSNPLDFTKGRRNGIVSAGNEVAMKFSIQKFGLPLVMVLFLSAGEPAASGATGPGESGLSRKHLALLDGLLEQALSRRDFPGAVILIGRKGKIVFRKAYGQSGWVPQPKPMDEDMIFDLASITKPVATATAFMILVEEGKISLEEKVKDYVPDFAAYVSSWAIPGDDARIWHLLTHTSGLPPYVEPGGHAGVEKQFGLRLPMEQLVAHIAKLPKTDPPGVALHYSCLGYITLAQIIKQASGRDIAQFSRERIFEPLRMKHTFYAPPPKCGPSAFPPVVGGAPLVGIVHDPLARLQGGVSGNAGLFSTADDLAVFAEMMLQRGSYRGKRILSPLTVARMTTVWPKAAFAGRGLGWDLDSPQSTNGGDLFGPHSYGHTGYGDIALDRPGHPNVLDFPNQSGPPRRQRRHSRPPQPGGQRRGGGHPGPRFRRISPMSPISAEAEVLEALDTLGISYTRHEHRPCSRSRRRKNTGPASRELTARTSFSATRKGAAITWSSFRAPSRPTCAD
jgi:CubicO group peptidase (beta-lactamase class C family)